MGYNAKLHGISSNCMDVRTTKTVLRQKGREDFLIFVVRLVLLKIIIKKVCCFKLRKMGPHSSRHIDFMWCKNTVESWGRGENVYT